MIRPPPRSPLFPYPPLSRSQRPADTSRADERDLREVLSLRDADPGRRRRELVLGLADIGPALEQRRRQPGRHDRARELLKKWAAPRNRGRVTPEQDRDEILGLLDPAHDVGNRRGRRVQQ